MKIGSVSPSIFHDLKNTVVLSKILVDVKYANIVYVNRMHFDVLDIRFKAMVVNNGIYFFLSFPGFLFSPLAFLCMCYLKCIVRTISCTYLRRP